MIKRYALLAKSLVFEYGIPWCISRAAYSMKLKFLCLCPKADVMFEKPAHVKRIDIFDLDTRALEAYLYKLPQQEQSKIIQGADQAIGGKICGFSSIDLDYGTPIHFHYHPLTKTTMSNKLKWFQIPDFDEARGDVKAIWEISRFSHLFLFSRAYMLTKDVKYYRAFSQQITQWLEQNPYSYGVNYKCGQECSLRMMNVLINYTVFQQYGLTTQDDTQHIFQLVQDSYRKVRSNFFYAYRCIQNNHTLSELCGYIVGAWCCEDTGTMQWAYRTLDQVIATQFFRDGGYCQHSFNYQRFALHIMEFVHKISTKTQLQISEKSKCLVKAAAKQLYDFMSDDGEVINFGSNDGALVFPVTNCPYSDFRPVINTTFLQLEGHPVFPPGLYDEELLWFSKPVHWEPVIPEQAVYHGAGLYSLRHHEGFLAVRLAHFTSRPAHQDGLHLDLWHDNKNIFCDSGTFSYASALGRQLAKAGAHNTVQLEGTEQMNHWGAFLTTNWSRAVDIAITDSMFCGTMISQNGYSHTRQVVKTAAGYQIRDTICSRREQQFCRLFFHTGCSCEIKGHSVVMDGKYMLIVDQGDISLEHSEISRYYLKKEQATCIVVQVPMIQKCRQITTEMILKMDHLLC